METVSRSFGSLKALTDVTMDVRPGHVHALIGANGSGKSTLVKLLSGALQPTSGKLYWDEKQMVIRSPADASSLGVRVVHQESPLIDTLSVLEAVATLRGYGTHGVRRIGWRGLRRDVATLLERMDVSVPLDEICGKISPAERAGLALAVAVAEDHARTSRGRDNDGGRPRLLILDEVTAAMPEVEATRYLKRVRELADGGVAVVMVTHRLPELSIADDVTILRGGVVVLQESGGMRRSPAEMVEYMIGPIEPADAADEVEARHSADPSDRHVPTRRRFPVRTLWATQPEAASSRRAEQSREKHDGLRLSEVSGISLQSVTMHVAPGEIVGFVGREQGGLRELPKILSGALVRRGGSITVCGRELGRRATPRDFIRSGVTVVPGDRLREGGVASLSVSENVALPNLWGYWRRRSDLRAVVEGTFDAFGVSPRDGRALFGVLSGGNQQRVLLGKWLALRPSVLVLDDPTQGVDPAARESVFDVMVDAAELRVSVLFFSTEPELLSRVCERVIVLRDGIIATELRGPSLTEERLMEWSCA